MLKAFFSRHVIVLLGLSFLMFMAGNHIFSLTNPDEVFYAGTAKEMAERHSWMVPYLFGQPQFEKPILTYWLIRLAYLVFGVTAFAARFFPALFAMAGVLAVYFFCRKVFADRKKALLCALVLMSSGLYVGLARTVFTDLIFGVFISLSLMCFYIGYSDRNLKGPGTVLFFVFAALALLTKGLLGLTMTFGPVGLFLLLRRDIGFMWSPSVGLGVVLFAVIGFPWYAYIIGKFGQAFIDEFFVNDHLRRLIEAEHLRNDRWYFYPGSLLLCFFPWSLTAIGAGWYLVRKVNEAKEPVYLFLACWIVVPFLTVQAAHSKLVSYLFPVYPAVAIAAGGFVRELFIRSKDRARVWALWSLGLFLIFPVAAAVAAVKFPQYVLRPRLLCSLMLGFAVLLFLQMVLVKWRPRGWPYWAALNMAMVLAVLLTGHRWVDDFVSSRNAACYLQSLPDRGKVLCSKIAARGMHFYSGVGVDVIALGSAQFFSPHPLVFVGSERQLVDYCLRRGRGVFYGLLDRGEFEGIKHFLRHTADCRVLREFGSFWFVEIDVH